MNYDKVGCIIINFLRPDATIKCIKTLLQQCPDIQIYLGDQDDDSKLEKHYSEANIHYFKLPFDCGISYARNKLITQALKDGCDYFMWIDNDFVFDNKLNLNHPITILENDASIGVVGGSMMKNGSLLHYERFMYYDKNRGVLTYVPINLTHPEPKKIDDVEYFDCDITFNFAIARKEVWKNPKVRWNERIKVKYEHSTWFLNFQQYSDFKVAYCPSFSAHHEHVGTPEYQSYRFRSTDEDEFAKYFNLKCMFTIGEAGRDFISKESAMATPKKLEKSTEVSTKPINFSLCPELRLLNQHEIIPVLLQETTLKAVQKKQLPMVYHLGFKNFTELQNAKALLDPSHVLEIYSGQTKPFNIEDIIVFLPCPVLPYLTHFYGKDWNI